MPKHTIGTVLERLRTIWAGDELRGLPDGELLGQFVADRDEAAFAALVHRHGPMVMGVCRRVLGDAHSAEDAFQATFMVLVRRARSVRREKPLANWLYAVAQRVALKARAKTAARQSRERELTNMPRTETLDELTWQELRPVLDEEIARLPKKCQAPIVLCYFEGLSYDQAAHQLGCPKSSLASRLERARELLRQRLVKRGITLSVGALTTALSEKTAGAAVGAMLTIKTVKAAASVAAGKAVAGGLLSAQAIALMEEAMKGMIAVKVKMVFAVIFLGLAAGGAGVAGYQGLGGLTQGEEGLQRRADAPKPAAPKPEAPARANLPRLEPQPKPRKDFYGDLLPEGAIARMGSVQMRHRSGHVVFSADGKTLVSGGKDGLVQWWDVSTGRTMQSKKMEKPESKNAFSDLARAAVLSPNGKTWAMLGNSKSVSLYDVETGKEIQTFDVEPAPRPKLAFSVDGKLLAVTSGFKDSKVLLCDPATGNHLVEWKHENAILALAFSQDSKLLATGDGIGLYIWDSATGKELSKVRSEERDLRSDHLAFSPDKKLIATVARATVTLWETNSLSKKATLSPSRPMRWQNPDCLAFSPDGKLLAVGSEEQLVLWDVQAEKELLRLPDWPVEHLAFAPDGKVLACVGQTGVHVWDVFGKKPLNRRQGHDVEVHSLVAAANGNLLASGGSIWDRNLLLWDAATGKPLGALQGHAGWAQVCGFSSNGQQVVSCAEDGTARVWDAATGKELHRFVVGDSKNDGKGQPGNVFRAGLFPDGMRLAVICLNYGQPGETQLTVWDVSTGQLEVRRPLPGGFKAWLLPDSRALITMRGSGLTIEDTITGHLLAPNRPPVLGKPVAFSSDGRVVAAEIHHNVDTKGYQLGGISVSEVATAREVLRLEGQHRFADLSADGLLLATADFEAIYLWETTTGKQLFRREWPVGKLRITSLRLLPKHRALATGMKDGTILVWDLAPETWPANAKIQPPDPKDLNALWADLADDDGKKAHRAIYTLAAAPTLAVPLLKQNLKPVQAADPKQVERLLADLDSDKFALRQAATKALANLGEQVEPALRKALESKSTLETRQRIEKILTDFRMAPTAETLRSLRAIRALELIGTAPARQVLEQIAKGVAAARETREAKEALERIGTR